MTLWRGDDGLGTAELTLALSGRFRPVTGQRAADPTPIRLCCAARWWSPGCWTPSRPSPASG
ncbi:MAG: hypothetical protein R2742_04400 [Micropruina glycogenica]